MKTVEILCPEFLMADANHLAAAKGQSMADTLTFRSANCTDGTTNYCWVGVQVGDEWLGSMTQLGERPAFDTNNQIDMTKAAAVLAGASILTTLPDGVSVIPSGLVVYVGTGLRSAFGLTPIPEAA